jgi:PIN domain nuclease of toxin-antitoxin system
MNLIVDTHTVLWAVDDTARLSPAATAAVQDPANRLLLSAASLWEVAIKVGLQKLVLALPYRQWMTRAVADLGLTVLPVTIEYAAVQSELPDHHRDPFDRLIVAQAIVEGVAVVSADATFDVYGIRRVW